MSILRWTPERLAAYEAAKKRVTVAVEETYQAKTVKIDAKAPKRPAKPSKYRNLPQTSSDGEKYRSKREMKRHQELLLMEKSGEIRELRREVPYELAPSVVIQGRKRPALRYFADFEYASGPVDEIVTEDCKGVRTEGYRIKRHLMMAIHGVAILET